MTKPKKFFLISFLILIALLFIYLLHLESIGWYFWHNNQSHHDQHELNLKEYHVVIDGLEINGLSNASDLTYNPNSRTLFTVLNYENKIVELSLKGEVIRFIDVYGADDMEGITYIDGNRFVIADERDNRLILVNIDSDATSVNISNSRKIRLGINERGNKNFEGVSWDNRQKQLIVVKERDPKYVVSVKGLLDEDSFSKLNLEIERLHKYDSMLGWAMRDLSSVEYIAKSGHMLLLSDESKLLKEFDENAKPLGAMLLWRGFYGLKKSVPQAEGVAIDENNNIYIMSEPNLFYSFKPLKIK